MNQPTFVPILASHHDQTNNNGFVLESSRNLFINSYSQYV